MSIHPRWAAWILFCGQVVQIVKSVRVNLFWPGRHWLVMHDCHARSMLKTSRHRFFFGQSLCTYFNPKIISWKSGNASSMSFWRRCKFFKSEPQHTYLVQGTEWHVVWVPISEHDTANNNFTGATETNSVHFSSFIVAPFSGCRMDIRSFWEITQSFVRCITKHQRAARLPWL